MTMKQKSGSVWHGVVLSLGLLHCSSTDATPWEPTVTAGGGGSAGAPSGQTAGAPSSGGTVAAAGTGTVAGNAGAGAGAGTGGTGNGAGGVSGAGAGGASAGQAGSAVGGAAGATGSSCNNPDWKFCDDFEKYPLGTVPNGVFYPYKANNKPAVGPAIATTTERKVSGSQSVKFHVDNTGRAFIDTDAPFPMPNDKFYGRMMIYLAQAPQGAVHWDIVSAYGAGGPEDGGSGNYRWGGMFGHTMANHHPGDEPGNVNNQHPKANQWLCYEWMFDGPKRVLEVWIDDYDRTAADYGKLNQPTWNAPSPWTTLQVGWAHYQNEQKGGEVWIDDLVVDDQRIGCPDKASVP